MPGPVIVRKVIREPDFLVEETDEEIIISGTDFVIPPIYFESFQSRNVTIRANRIVLNEDINAFGKQVMLVCKVLEVPRQVAINVYGVDGKAFPARAADGITPGAGGKNGAKGNKGGDGGSVYLYIDRFIGPGMICNANGGNGGQGQQGGNGTTGGNGQNSPDRHSPRSIGTFSGFTGGKGMTGGAAGAGGDGGNGGKGGVISINFLQDLSLEIFQLFSKGGLPGAVGENGKPGDGGQGGQGGIGWFCEQDDPRGPLRG